jgi:hypothetical protein
VYTTSRFELPFEYKIDIMPPKKVPMRHRNPWIIYTVRDLFAIFGLAAWVFIALQVGAAFVAGKLALEYLKIPLAITVGVHRSGCATANCLTYFKYRGRLHTVVIPPALLVLTLTVAPFVVLWLAHFIFDIQALS